ncbi:MAG: transporter substrate-binding domain-containing protein, partial [Puniceicoccales bacterium]|nr:transporter substrate-binding domain-containing protein [Puniceicoccales bacterium]
MKKNILLLIVVALCGTIIWLHYPNGKDSDIIKFGTCADYPPMEYYKEDVLTGFEVELAKLIAEKLGKKAAFEDMAFASLPTALKKKFIDAIIAAFGVTKESRQKFDFSIPYYPEVMVFMHKESDSITTKEHLSK